MIARENLEKRQTTLVARMGVLALERLNHEEQSQAIAEEMRQIGVLLKVIGATLEDVVEDEAGFIRRIDELDANYAHLQKVANQLVADNPVDEEASNGDGGTESI